MCSDIDRISKYFDESLSNFKEAHAQENPSPDSVAILCKDMAYVALLCGGGEVALYTLVGAFFRKILSLKEDKSFFLAIDSHKWVGSKHRPDFQVYRKKINPLFAVEFKVLDHMSATDNEIEGVFDEIRSDARKLQEMMCLPEPRIEYAKASLVVFIRSNNSERLTADWNKYMPEVPITPDEVERITSNFRVMGANKNPGKLSVFSLGSDEIKKINYVPKPVNKEKKSKKGIPDQEIYHQNFMK